MAVIISNIAVGIIALIGTIFSALSKQNSDLVNFRINQLEQKVDKTEQLQDDVLVLKEQVKTITAMLTELKKEV